MLVVKLSFLLWAFPAIIVLCAGYYFVSRDDEKVEIGESAKSLLDDVLITVASPLTDEKEIKELFCQYERRWRGRPN